MENLFIFPGCAFTKSGRFPVQNLCFCRVINWRGLGRVMRGIAGRGVTRHMSALTTNRNQLIFIVTFPNSFLSDPVKPGVRDLTDVTLDDEDINSILTDNSNRAIQGNLMAKFATSTSVATSWPTLETMQVAPPGTLKLMQVGPSADLALWVTEFSPISGSVVPLAMFWESFETGVISEPKIFAADWGNI